MVRAAAKNHAHVGVVVDPADYAVGARRAPRRRRARPADPASTGPHRVRPHRRLRRRDRHLVRRDDAGGDADESRCRRRSTSRSSWRSRCATARTRTSRAPATARPARTSWWDTMTQHGGKELSYLNVFDTEAAWRLVHRFDEPACVVVKHANPCGVAVADDITEAYVRANACDPVSAFGGIVAANRTVTAEMAAALGDGVHRGRRRPGLRARGARDPRREEEPAGDVGERRRRRCRSTCAPSTAASSSSSPTRSPVAATTWRVVTAAQPTDAQWARSRVRLAGVRGGEQQRHRLRQGSARRSASAPASRTGSTRRASRRSARRAGRPAARARATRSSRSATASTRPRRPGSRRSSSPADRCATTR